MRLAWRNLLHDPVRLLVTVAGIAFAVFLMIFEGSLLAGFLRASSEIIDATEAEIWVTPRGTPCFDFPSPLPERFRAMAAGVPGVEAVDRVAAGFGTLLRSDGTRQGVIIIGADPGVGAAFPRPRADTSAVDMPESVVVDESDFGLLGLTVTPDDVELENKRCRVAGAVTGFGSFLGSPYVFASHHDAVRYLGLGSERTSYLLCRVKPGHDVGQVKEALAARLPETDVQTRSEFAQRSRAYWVLQTGAGGAILTAALLGFVVGVVIVSQTIYATTMENLEEYATLRAMGATRTFLSRIVLIQALAGGLAGYASGLLASLPVLALLRGAISWVHTPWWMPLGMLAASLIMGGVASLTSIRKVISVEPGRVFRA